MQVFEPKEGQGDGQLQVVEHAMVQQLTLSGWGLVFAYQEEVLEPCYDQVPNPNPPQQNYGYPPPTIQTTRYERVTRTKFVMRLGEASALAIAHAKAACAESEIARLTTEIKELRDHGDAKEKDHKATTQRLESCQRMLSDDRAVLQRSEETRRKLEADVGKIRVAIGSKQMEEILGNGKT
jgi:ribosomal protein S15P/S13E